MKNTKRSIIISAILAIMMCASLIVGGTLALFTSTGKVNIAVTSGNVEVVATAEITELSHIDEDGKTVTGKLFSGDAKFDGNTLTISNMLPKDTVKFDIKIENNSNVTVKYRTVLTVEEDNGLVSWLDIDLNGYKFAGDKAATKYKTLAKDADGVIETIPVVVALPENATCNNTTCKLSVTVEAVQGNASVTDGLTAAADKIVVSETVKGTTWYSLIDGSSLLKAVAGKKALASDVTIKEDIDLPLPVYATEGDVTINAEGKTIENTADIWDKDSHAWSLVSARETANLTLNGGNYQAKENDCYAVDVQDGATLTITSGTFNGNIHAVYVQEGTACIKGGFFSVQQKYPDASKANEFVLNCYDANREKGTAKIIVTGGTFVNFNPADNYAEGAHTNFVADGYEVISEQHGEDTWYKVCKVVSTVEDLKKTFADGKNVKLDGDIATNNGADTTAARLTITKPTTLNFGDYKLKSPDDMGNNNNNFAALFVYADTIINANANGGIDTGKNGGYGINVRNGAKLVINGGYYYGGGTAVQVEKGELEINGGFFACEPYSNPTYGCNFLINCYDPNYKNGTAKVSIKGGTFVNFNPANCTAEGAGTNFVADGYTVVSETKDNGDVWYTVAKVVKDAKSFVSALTEGGDVAFTENVSLVHTDYDTTAQKLFPYITLNKDVTLNLAGKKLTIDESVRETDTGKASLLMMAVTGGTLTINGDGELNCEDGGNQVYGINVNGGKVVINGGNYYGAITAIQVQKGSLEINGGFFDMAPTCKAAVPQYAKYVVNCIDSAYKNGTATISIKGGTFVNFDPSADPEGAGTTYVADGYKVVSATQTNGDVWYTVVKA